MYPFQKWFFLALSCALMSCRGGASSDDAGMGYRLPLVEAPLDTSNVIVTVSDSAAAAAGTGDAIRNPSWTNAKLPSYPDFAHLDFARYQNIQMGYSIAYPDTILKPGEPIGEGRGLEFGSREGDIRMLVYGVEKSTQDDLENQYRSVLENPEMRMTYRAREETLYIVSGRQGNEIVYEKSVLQDGVLRTFRIQYPASKKAYFDGLTAIMSASF